MRFTGGESELGLEEWVKVGQVKKDGKAYFRGHSTDKDTEV